MKFETNLVLSKLKADRRAFITVEDSKCQKCNLMGCIRACSANCFALQDQHVTFSYDACVRCGWCRAVVACKNGAVKCVDPQEGFGTNHYRKKRRKINHGK